MPDDSAFGRFGSGREVKRIEDAGLLAGTGRFTDDFVLPGQTHLCFLRSPHPHARIVSIDVSAALEMPGVISVITGADLAAAGVNPIPLAPIFKRPDGTPTSAPLRTALAIDTVRFVGEGVAAVVAETREQARDALEAIEVDYDTLPAVADMTQAIAPGAPLVWDDAPGNLAAESRYGDAVAVDAAFREAAHVVTLDIVNQRLAPTPLEPRSSLATFDPETERLILQLSSQMPSGSRDAISGALSIPTESVRVLVGDVGGGFGMKSGAYPEDIVVAYAARALKRPVKWTAERIEEFLAATHGRAVESTAQLSVDADGKVTGFRVKTLAEMGAYPGTAGILIQLVIGPFVSTSIYDIRAIDLTFTAIMTNTAPTAAYRGAGRPEAIFIIERLFDEAARKLGLDPAELRRRNMIAPSQMPYQNAMGQTYDSGKFESVLDQALTLADWNGFAAREAASKAEGKLRGRGLASFLEWTGANVFEERVTISVGEDEIEVYATTQAMGQGIATSYAQLVVDTFDVPIEKIRIVLGDSDRGSGFGSAGSRSLFTAGSAIRVASDKTITAGKDLAGDALEAAAADIEYSGGQFRIAGTDRAIGLFELAGRQPERRIFIDSTSAVSGPSWPNGCHICEVEIDPETGIVDIVSYASVNDAGRVVNPMIVRGQLDGGAVQGLGQALMENLVYDASGQILAASFMDYAMPRADIVRAFRTELDQTTPCLTNPLGVKGVGELGTIGATPALVNAVADALARGGHADSVPGLQMPLSPARVWAALQ